MIKSLCMVVLKALLQASVELVLVVVLILAARFSWKLVVRMRRHERPAVSESSRKETKLEIGETTQICSSRPTVADVGKDSPAKQEAAVEKS